MPSSKESFDSLVYLLHEVNHKMYLAKEEILSREGISFPQMIVLGFLKERKDDDVNLKSVCSQMKIKGSSVTSLINNMVKNGLIDKNVNPFDGRECFLTLTQKGDKLSERIKDLLSGIDERATGVLTEEEKNTMISIMRKLLASERNASTDDNRK